jgi:hypothetical protein
VRCLRGFVFERGFAETGFFLAIGCFFFPAEGGALVVFSAACMVAARVVAARVVAARVVAACVVAACVVAACVVAALSKKVGQLVKVG